MVSGRCLNIASVAQEKLEDVFSRTVFSLDCLCGLMVRVAGYRFRGPGFYSRHYQIFWDHWGPLNLVSTTEELTE
jgi:hypothetical protein